jgi:hypothetical protein
MAAPKNPAELALVRLAITCRVKGCVEWHDKAARIFREQETSVNLDPPEVKQALIDQVAGGKEVVQVPETRPEWSHFDFYYKVILDFDWLPRGLFIELRLNDDDPDVPTVQIVSAHRQLS